MPSEEHVRRFAEIFGAAGEAVLERLRPWSPRLRAHVYDYIAGDLYADPALPVRTRELVVIATLAAQGGMAEQLAVHLQVALDNGATVAEIIGTLETVGTYAGVPRALNALFTAAEVFARRGLAATEPAESSRP
jgi:4-carboxymuconolactone decarboxylase